MEVSKAFASTYRLILAVCSIAFIIGYIPFFSEGFTYDEPHYLSNVELLSTNGLGNTFLQELKGPAGPLHALVYYIVNPIVGGSVFMTRLVSAILGILALGLLYLLLKKVDGSKGDRAFLMLSVPMAFSAMGLAHTEMPAMFFIVGFLYCFYKMVIESSGITWGIISAVLFSLAIAGRQPYILIGMGFLVFLLAATSSRVKTQVILTGAITLLLPIYLFYIWGGVAPDTGRDIATEGVVAPLHMILSFGYGAVIMLLLAPSFFTKLEKRDIHFYTIVFLIALLACYFLKYDFIVMYTTMKVILPESILPFIGSLTAAGLATVCFYFLRCLYNRCIEKRHDTWFLFCAFSLTVLLISPLFVTHIFSSRYVFQAAPFFVIIASYYSKDRVLDLSLNTVGVLMGVLSSLMYE